ncbi:hypothetical protein BC943DRAFT_21712 [Umbelopsis sp. AD052]|nr:hypothetical protein BC943DRAFT_21712 [Umbelopsis sp. AD052]
MSVVARTDKTVVLDPRPAFSNGLQNDQDVWKLRSGQFNLSQPYFGPKKDMPQRAKRRKTEPSNTEQQTLETFQSLQPYFEQCMQELISAWPAIKDSLCEPDNENAIPHIDNPPMIDFVKSAELVKVVKSFAFQLDPEQPEHTMILQGKIQ